jgi:hypothetical protein
MNNPQIIPFSAGGFSHALDFMTNSFHISWNSLFLPGICDKVAIGAPASAKRDMQVDARWFHYASIPHMHTRRKKQKHLMV